MVPGGDDSADDPANIKFYWRPDGNPHSLMLYHIMADCQQEAMADVPPSVKFYYLY